MKAAAHARHETANRRFKQYGVLSQTCRHKLHRHGTFFQALANADQLAFMVDQPLFDVEYNDRKLE